LNHERGDGGFKIQHQWMGGGLIKAKLRQSKTVALPFFPLPVPCACSRNESGLPHFDFGAQPLDPLSGP
jgi:hypothetical protein